MRGRIAWQTLGADAALISAFIALSVQMEGEFGTQRVVAVAVLSVVAVVTRHRWPVPTLVTAIVATSASIVEGHLSGALWVLLGLLMFTAALSAERRQPWAYPLGTSALLFLIGVAADPQQWWSPSSIGAFVYLCGCAAIGDAVRNRRAYIAEMAERLRQAEQTREEEARRRVIDERLRIARELHDVVAHHIAVINVQAGAAGHVIERHPEQAGPVLELIRKASDDVLREIKSVVGVLRDPAEAHPTGPSPGLSGLPELVAGLTATGFRIDVKTHGAERELPAIVDLAAYRIAQEALTNAHRYGSGGADLVVTYTFDDVTVEVTNTIGPSRPVGSGFGLLGMRERATAAGGTVTAGPVPGGRFRLHAVLPTPAYAQEIAP